MAWRTTFSFLIMDFDVICDQQTQANLESNG